MSTRFEIPTGSQFGTVYVDPPWPQDENQNSRRRLHYDRMTIDEICALPVGDAVHEDGHLWIWTTTRHLPHTFRVIEAWGFEYKATCVWKKSRLGNGWWIRNRHEFLMIAAKSTKLRHNPGSWDSEITGKSGKHSEKPESAYERIEALSPGPFLELFSRSKEPREGWTTLGVDGVPREAYGRFSALPEGHEDKADGIVRGVGGLEIHPTMDYVYLKKEIIHVPVKAISQKGRRVTVAFADGTKKSVSIDKLRAVDA